ncbi:hypothetical protein X764_08025 [Mesorhizobium sp. LSHC440A00]|nr:hypothetical protein X764_08025 [Mesorhizobium sp. LSHC440A00]
MGLSELSEWFFFFWSIDLRLLYPLAPFKVRDCIQR